MTQILRAKTLTTAAAVLLAGAMIGALVAFLVVGVSPNLQPVAGSASVDVPQDQNVGMWWSREPASIQELVNRADAIVVGTIGPVRRTEMVGPSGDLSKYPAGVPLPLKPFTDYQINIQEVILDDGFIRAEPTLVIPGVPERYGHIGFLMALSPTDSYLFVLIHEPRSQKHAMVSRHGVINLSGPSIALAGRDLTRPDFANGMAPSDFLEAVKAALPTRKHSPPSEW